MAKHIFYIHGRNFKPDKDTLANNWQEAVYWGIDRDYGKEGTDMLLDTKQTVIYYGDLSNKFLLDTGGEYDMPADIKDREQSLEKLKKYHYNQFTRSNYLTLNKISDWGKKLADIFSTPLSYIGLGELLVGKVAPDLKQYWKSDSSWGSDVRWRLTEPLVKALEEGDEVLLVAHSLGTMIAYDVLWKLSYYGEYQHLRDKKIDFITLGSPLGDRNVMSHLKGNKNVGSRKYPNNINQWINVAADDDFVSHVDKLSSRFANIIEDKFIYNLSIRFNKSNPHHGAGYLISPVTAYYINDWLYE